MLKDLKLLFKEKNDAQLTYIIKRMLEKHLLRRNNNHTRKYTINLNAYALTRGMLNALINENLVEFE